MSSRSKIIFNLSDPSLRPSHKRNHYTRGVSIRNITKRHKDRYPESRKNKRKTAERTYLLKKHQQYLNSGGRGFYTHGLPPGTRFENATQKEIYRVQKGDKEALMVYNGERPKEITRANGTHDFTVEYEFHKLSDGEPFIIPERALPRYRFYSYTPSEANRKMNADWERRKHLIEIFHQGPRDTVAATTGGGSAATTGGGSAATVPLHTVPVEASIPTVPVEASMVPTVPVEGTVTNTPKKKTLAEILAGKTVRNYKPLGHTDRRRKSRRRA